MKKYSSFCWLLMLMVVTVGQNPCHSQQQSLEDVRAAIIAEKNKNRVANTNVISPELLRAANKQAQAIWQKVGGGSNYSGEIATQYNQGLTTPTDVQKVMQAALVQANQDAQVAKNPSPALSQSTNAAHKSKEQETLEGLSTQNDVPIVFYGKVEDQFGDAIGGAVVNFGVRIYNGSKSTVKTGQLTSDADGLFTISGYKGESLGLGTEKLGYVFTSMNGSGIYSHLYPEEQRAHQDQSNPTVIKMWKLQGGQPLTHFTFNTRVPRDGKPVLFDFHTGKVVETGGDFVISLECPLKPDTSRQYDWQAIIQPVDGGIVAADSSLELRFQAPDDGYDSKIEIKNIADVKPWASTFHGGFYFKNHNGGCYGKLDLGVVVYAIKDGLVPITIDGYINPAGLRNLEIDPAKITEAHP